MFNQEPLYYCTSRLASFGFASIFFEDLLGIIRDIIGLLEPILEPILEMINIISGIYTLDSFLEGLSFNINNVSSLIIFLLSFILMYMVEEKVYRWLRSLVGL